MILISSYFFTNFSLAVLIKFVLTYIKKCREGEATVQRCSEARACFEKFSKFHKASSRAKVTKLTKIGHNAMNFCLKIL